MNEQTSRHIEPRPETENTAELQTPKKPREEELEEEELKNVTGGEGIDTGRILNQSQP